MMHDILEKNVDNELKNTGYKELFTFIDTVREKIANEIELLKRSLDLTSSSSSLSPEEKEKELDRITEEVFENINNLESCRNDLNKTIEMYRETMGGKELDKETKDVLLNTKQEIEYAIDETKSHYHKLQDKVADEVEQRRVKALVNPADVYLKQLKLKAAYDAIGVNKVKLFFIVKSLFTKKGRENIKRGKMLDKALKASLRLEEGEKSAIDARNDLKILEEAIKKEKIEVEKISKDEVEKIIEKYPEFKDMLPKEEESMEEDHHDELLL